MEVPPDRPAGDGMRGRTTDQESLVQQGLQKVGLWRWGLLTRPGERS